MMRDLQEFVAIAGAEAQRNAEPDPEKRKYPGGAFDPLGFSKDSKVGRCRCLIWRLQPLPDQAPLQHSTTHALHSCMRNQGWALVSVRPQQSDA
jgi:hypothetical protein